MLSLAMILLALAGTTACGTGKPTRAARAETARQVAALLRATWGVSTGSPAFDYTCMRLDDSGRLFSCLARDHYRIVRLASFDVVCTASNCSWTSYPAYLG
jgi:hypothetical protein